MSYVTIRGSGFNDISEVWFGAGKANTWTVNPNYTEIYAQVPIDATTGRIRLISARRQKTGVSTQASGFWTVPYLTNYIQTSFDMIPGAYIHLDGYHMRGITGATINNLSLTTPPTVVNGNRILLVAPSGNCRGAFRVWSIGNIRVMSPFTYNPNIPITGVNKTGLLTGEGLLVTGRFWVPELMNPAGGNTYYGRIGDNGQRMTFTRISHEVLSGTVPTGAQNGPVYIEREDGYDYCNNNLKLDILRTPILTGFKYSLTYYPDSNVAIGNHLNRITGIKYRTTNLGGYTLWQDYSGGWRVNNDNTELLFSSTGFSKSLNEYISGNYTQGFMSMAFYYQGGSGLLEYNLPPLNQGFVLARTRENGNEFFYNLVFTGNNTFSWGSFFTGSGLVQRRSSSAIASPYGWWVEYRLSGISGFNWYATGISATGTRANDENGYGLPRTFRINKASNRTLVLGSTGWPLVGSGLLTNTIYSGLPTGFYSFGYTYICEDGFVSGASGLLMIRR